MRMLSVGYLAEDCSSLVDSGAPTRRPRLNDINGLLMSLFIFNNYLRLHRFALVFNSIVE